MGAWDPQNAGMPVYLLFAGLANILFSYISAKDLITRASAETVALLALAFAEFAWVIPCCIQCFLVFADASPADDYKPKNEETGCDVQGFYSVFASLSGQMILTQIASLTWARATSRPYATHIAAFISAGLLLLSLILALLPVFGVGNYAYSGEGFCYFDWLDSTHVAILETVSITCMLLTLSFFGLAAFQGEQWFRQLKERKSQQYSIIWIGFMMLAYVAAWILWIPGGFIGLAGTSRDDFPDGLMLSGAIMGHATALVNPALYGVVWRSWMMDAPKGQEITGKEKFALVQRKTSRQELNLGTV